MIGNKDKTNGNHHSKATTKKTQYKILLDYDPVNVETFAKLKEKLKNNGHELSLISEWVNLEYGAISPKSPTNKDLSRERFIESLLS